VLGAPKSNPNRSGFQRTDHKTLSVAALSDYLGFDGDGVVGFSPERWVAAAGVLEKKRDGRMREGWAKRFFVLSKDTLFYYLIPKLDMQGNLPLLGEERGQIKLLDIQDVSINSGDADSWCLTITVSQLRKQSAAGYLSTPVSQLQLRAPRHSGQLWAQAILAARDSIRSGTSPSSSYRKVKRMTSSAKTDDSTESVVAHSATASTALPKLTAGELRNVEEILPLEKSTPVVWMLAAVAVAFGVLFALDVDRFSSALTCTVILAWFMDTRQRQYRFNSAAKDARFTIETLRKHFVRTADVHHVGAETGQLCADELLEQSLASTVASAPPLAGSTVPNKPDVNDGSMTCFQSKGEAFKLRIGPNYKANGKKAPSAEPLYDLLGVDLFRSTVRLCNVVGNEYVTLPPLREGVDDVNTLRQSGLPRIFVVNAQIPDKAPVMMGKAPEDAGYSLVFYFVCKPETAAAVVNNTATPAAKMLLRYVSEHAINPDTRRRFKGMGMADNVKELGIPGVGPLIEKFNGKPFIINKVAEIFQGPDWFEVDLSVFDFPFLARKALYSLKDRVAEISVRAGFVVQGESDEELPEILLGGAELRGMDS